MRSSHTHHRPTAKALARDPDLGHAAGELVARKLVTERALLAATFADPAVMLPIADGAGVTSGDFHGTDTAALWLALLWGCNSGRLTGDLDADHLALVPLVRRALQAVNCWRDAEQSESSILWSPLKLTNYLFHGTLPVKSETLHLAREVLKLGRRLRDAAALLDDARKVLAEDDAPARRVRIFNATTEARA